MAEPIVMLFGLWAWIHPRNHELDGDRDPHEKWQFWGKGSPIVKHRDLLPWAVQKRLTRSICRFSSRLGCMGRRKHKFNHICQVAPMCPHRTANWHQFARRCQCAHIRGQIGVTWWIRLNRPSAAAMWSYVKLLWPLVLCIFWFTGAWFSYVSLVSSVSC